MRFTVERFLGILVNKNINKRMKGLRSGEVLICNWS